MANREDIEYKYQKARRLYDRTLDKVSVAGNVGMSKEKEHKEAYDQMDRWRSVLIANGWWEGPRPL